MSKKQERLRSELLSEDKTTNLFFDIIKPRRIEHLQNQEPISSDPYFSTWGTWEIELAMHCAMLKY